jgi:hypothetical protein
MRAWVCCEGITGAIEVTAPSLFWFTLAGKAGNLWLAQVRWSATVHGRVVWHNFLHRSNGMMGQQQK